MDALPQLTMLLSQQSGPVLTWYGSERVELTGPALARWITKCANLLGTDYAGDLFGEEPSASSLRLSLGTSWQSLLWQISAELMGWTVLMDEAEHPLPAPSSPVDVHVSATTEPLEHSDAPWRLLHNLSPLAFSWGQELPAGTLDALAELMAQSDFLEVDPRQDAPTWEEVLTVPPLFPIPTQPEARLCVSISGEGSTIDARTSIQAWQAGASLVVINTDHHCTEDIQRIALSERSTLRYH